MAKTTKRIAWTPAHLKMLKSLAGRKTPKAIAKQLNRTEAAVRFKAYSSRISLAMR